MKRSLSYIKIKLFNDYKVSYINNNPLLIPNIFFIVYISFYNKNKNLKNYTNPFFNNSSDLKESNIFIKNINNKYKLAPLNLVKNNVGETKYFPSDSKEWNNSIYYFNSNYMKNLPIYDTNINKLLKGYFDLYFNRDNIKSKFISLRKKRLSLNKVFISKAEIKHTSSKAVITIYTYNRERVALLKKLENLKKSFYIIRDFFTNVKVFPLISIINFLKMFYIKN